MFSSFDTKLTFFSQGIDGHPNVVLFDPETDGPVITFFDQSAADGDSAPETPSRP